MIEAYRAISRQIVAQFEKRKYLFSKDKKGGRESFS